MKTEYEVKFVDVDIDAVRRQLQDVGAVLVKPMRLMRRAIIENPEMKTKNAFVRVRDEGDRVTLTYKQFTELSVEGAKEYEVVVNDFDETVALLAAAGMPYGSLQESKRETWHYEDAEIVIDVWPWLNPYIEIESISVEKVKAFSEQLGFAWETAVFGDVMAAYRVQYPHLKESDTVARIAEVKFDDPLPGLLAMHDKPA